MSDLGKVKCPVGFKNIVAELYSFPSKIWGSFINEKWKKGNMICYDGTTDYSHDPFIWMSTLISGICSCSLRLNEPTIELLKITIGNYQEFSIIRCSMFFAHLIFLHDSS